MKKQDNWLYKNGIGIAEGPAAPGERRHEKIRLEAGLLNYQQNIVRLKASNYFLLHGIISKSDEIWWVIDRALIADSIC